MKSAAQVASHCGWLNSTRLGQAFHWSIEKKMNETLRTSISRQFSNTPPGFLRIKKNLNIVHLSDNETELFLRKIILSTPLESIETKGKNHYFKCLEYNVILTVNASTFTVITAKQLLNQMENHAR
ncbi:MAG: DUF3781 domain-containing protein [Desulfonatronovibrio sp.]